MTKQVQKHNGKGIVYLDRHPIIAEARRKFEIAGNGDVFRFNPEMFYSEIANYFNRFFHSDRTYLDRWNYYPAGDRDFRYTNIPTSFSFFPVFGVSGGDFAIYALFPLNPTPVLDKDSKTLDKLSDGVAILNSDLRIRGVSCLFTSDLYDEVCNKLGICINVPPMLASKPEGLLQKYEQSLAEAKQELIDICAHLRIDSPIRHKTEAPKISKSIKEKFEYKGSFGVWLP